MVKVFQQPSQDFLADTRHVYHLLPAHGNNAAAGV
jgi:hypothetical protein